MPGKQSSVTAAKQGGAIFCVDVGSGSARAAYCAPGKEPVLLDNPNGAPNRRYHPNEFSTSLYLDDPADPDRQQVYRGENELQNSGLVSWPAKFAIYRLQYRVDQFPAEVRDQYPHVSLPPCSEQEEDSFREAIRRGWRQLFEATRGGLERYLHNHGHPFPHRLVVTTPPHWEGDLDLSEKVCALIGDVFPEVPKASITAWSEPEALLHQIATERWFHKKVFGDGGEEEPSAVVSLIDCGGHNTGVVNCYLAFNRQTKHVTIQRLDDSCHSAGGGGERWEWEVAELYNKLYLESNRDKPGFNPDGLTLAEKQTIRDAFCVAKRTMNCHTGDNVKATSLEMDATLRATITKDDMIKTFNNAFQFPKKVAAEAIKKLAENKNPNKHVILCGGSAKNPGVRDMITELCLQARLDPPVATAIEGTPRYNKHAQGGALIEKHLGSQDVTPKKYFGELGNVIALQLGTNKNTPGSKDVFWDHCSILYPRDDTNDDGDEAPVYIVNSALKNGHKRMVKILCGKVGDQLPANSRAARWGGAGPKFQLGHTYELLPREIQLDRQGTWGVRLTNLPLEEDANSPGELKFKLEFLHRSGSKVWSKKTKVAYFTLHWSAGCGCLLLFDSNTSVEESIMKMSEEHEDHEYGLWEPFPGKESAPKKDKKPARPRASRAKGKVQKTTPSVETAPAHKHHHLTRSAFRQGRVASAAAGTQPVATQPAATPLAGTQPAGTQLAGTQPAGAQVAGVQLAGTEPATNADQVNVAGNANATVQDNTTTDQTATGDEVATTQQNEVGEKTTTGDNTAPAEQNATEEETAGGEENQSGYETAPEDSEAPSLVLGETSQVAVAQMTVATEDVTMSGMEDPPLKHEKTD
ncbi:hypothetical protein QBC37DRAFT_381169 [Rhypophila decipiens]|uniref:Actin-like ATPase domain-containing protein n=1 Tax=Rhypophila decipiens TaxID=261697 RepID=A0AAN7B0G5_9PEZI|nr:hypothetical protein QBC37DRAFT_381169 [Rhypophila decipiens]